VDIGEFDGKLLSGACRHEDNVDEWLRLQVRRCVERRSQDRVDGEIGVKFK
jgi:hypothetical protein